MRQLNKLALHLIGFECARVPNLLDTCQLFADLLQFLHLVKVMSFVRFVFFFGIL